MEDTLRQHDMIVTALLGTRKVIGKEKAKEFEALLPDDIKRLTSARDIAEAIGRTEEVPIEFKLLMFRKTIGTALSSHQTLLQAATEIQKLKIEPKMLDYLNTIKRYGPYNCLDNPTTDYFCLLKGGEGLFYQDLVHKILYLRNQLMRWEVEYVGILQGKCSKNENDVAEEIAHSRRELENAEKLYLISRMRSFHSRSSTEVEEYISSDDENLLKKMSRLKMEVMMLEDTYVELLEAEKTYSHHARSTYSEDVLQTAVSRRRELLVLQEECFMPLKERISTADVASMSFESLQEVIRMIETIKFDPPLKEEGMYPSFVHDNNIHYQIDLLEMMARLREDFLTLEDVYLCLLQDRYMKDRSDKSSSLNFSLIYSEYIWEYLLEIIVNWRNYLRLLEDTYGSKLEMDYSRMGVDSSTLKHDLQRTTEFKQMEEEYHKLIREWHLTIDEYTSSIDVAQIYDKYIIKQQVLDTIVSSKNEINEMEMKRYAILETHAARLHEHTGRYIKHNIDDQLHHIAIFRKRLREIEDIYFYMLQHKNGSKYSVQHGTPRSKDSESSESAVEEEREFLTMLYNSIKSCNFYCSKCMTCVNIVIQHALELEDDEISHDEDEEVPEICSQALHKFLSSRSLCCSSCKSYIRIVTIRRAKKLKRRSVPQLGRNSTASTSNKEDVKIRIEAERSFQQSSSAGRWKIQRSIVLGGLIESITSLAILTSAANANISDGNIITLALANMITGLFLVRHNLSGLEKKMVKQRYCSPAGLGGSRYKQILREKLQYFLHFTVAFLSFLLAGLVAPLVYALSFHESRNKNLKIITAAGASLSCTAFLAIQKARIQNSTNWLVCVKTATIYVSIGVAAFVLSYVGGYVFGQLIDKLS